MDERNDRPSGVAGLGEAAESGENFDLAGSSEGERGRWIAKRAGPAAAEVVLRVFFLLDVRGGGALAANAARWFTKGLSGLGGDVRFGAAALASCTETLFRVSGWRIAACPLEEEEEEDRTLLVLELGSPWSVAVAFLVVEGAKLA